MRVCRRLVQHARRAYREVHAALRHLAHLGALAGPVVDFAQVDLDQNLRECVGVYLGRYPAERAVHRSENCKWFRSNSVDHLELAMANPVAAWHTEHVYFGRLLDLLQKQVDVFRSGERPNYEAMLDIIEYLRHYTDRVHHPREDAAFAFLARRRPNMQLELEHLSQEHRVLAQAGEMLLKHLNEIVEGAVVHRAEDRKS